MRVSYILCQESLSQEMGYQVIVVSPNYVILDTGDIPISPKITESWRRRTLIRSTQCYTGNLCLLW